jgi:urea transport system substrate-binding protein
LTGDFPYQDAGRIVQIMFAHCSGEVLDPSKSKASLPAACSQIVARATAKKPEERYQDGNQMLADLNAVIAALSGTAAVQLPSQSGVSAAAPPKVPRGPRRGRWYVTAGACALVAALAASWFFWRTPAVADRAAAAAAAAIVPVPTGPPIVVGVLHSLTGSMEESESPVVDATLLAIEELNRSGGLLGRPIKPIVRDGRSDPQVFAEEARRLIVDEKVCTVFGCWTSASRKTVLPIFERHDHLLVYPVQYEGLEQSPQVIYLGAAPNQQIIPAVRWFFAFQNKRRFFLVGSDYVFPRTANAIIRDVLSELGGEVVGEEYLPLGSYDVAPIVERIVAARPDAILNTINGDSNVPFFRRLRAAGVTPEKLPTLSFSIGEQELRRFGGEMAGDYAAWNYFQSLDSPANTEFVERFRAKYGPLRVISDPMEAAYVGVKLWAQAVRQAGSDNVKQIRGAFDNQKLLAPEGQVTIDPQTHHAYKTPRVGQVDAQGQFDVVWTEIKPERPVPFPPSRTRQAWEEFLQELYTGWGGQWAAPAR